MDVSFARSLLLEGRITVGAHPMWQPTDADVQAVRSALAMQSLHLPGPRLEGSLPTLVQATAVVYRAAWRYFHAMLDSAADDPGLSMPGPPGTPAEHFAADLAFRFLPGLYRRALHRDPEDPLASAIRALLRQWPLSGVLADLTESPTTSLDFGGHPGLKFLYAERLAHRERAAWLPQGADRDCLEVVYHTLGKALPAPLEPEPGAVAS